MAGPRHRRSGDRRSTRTLIAAVIGLTLVLTGVLVGGGVAAAAAPTRQATFDKQMIALVNQARAAKGLPAVLEAPGLTSLSVWWSTRMAAGGTGYVLKHNPDAWNMLPSYGAANRTSWGENVAKFSPSNVPAMDIFTAYMNSPGHRANILGTSYRFIGMGTMSGHHGTFNTMTFTDKVDVVQVRAANIMTTGHGRLYAVGTGNVRVAGVRYAIRNADCTRTLVRMTTANTGTFPLALRPNNYCAVPETWPKAYNRPATLHFSVAPGQTFKLVSKVPAKAVAGRLYAKSAAGHRVANLVYDIRDGACRASIVRMRTASGGTFPLTLKPSTYCAVPLSAPPGYRVPYKTIFTVRAGTPFQLHVTVPRAS